MCHTVNRGVGALCRRIGGSDCGFCLLFRLLNGVLQLLLTVAEPIVYALQFIDDGSVALRKPLFYFAVFLFGECAKVRIELLDFFLQHVGNRIGNAFCFVQCLKQQRKFVAAFNGAVILQRLIYDDSKTGNLEQTAVLVEYVNLTIADSAPDCRHLRCQCNFDYALLCVCDRADIIDNGSVWFGHVDCRCFAG